MIFIRTDANEKIGTGHVMRCLSIACQIRRLKKDVSFVIADDCSKAMIEEQGYSTVCLHSQWDDLNQEIGKLCQLIINFSVDRIFVDSYFVTEQYLSVLRKRIAVFFIDDLNMMPYPVDVLVNYNIYGPKLDYSGINGKLLLGARYAPLREEFAGIKKRKYSGVSKILITSGGTDNYNIIEKVLSKLLSTEEYKNKEYYCILGRFNKDVGYLNEKFSEYRNIHLLQNISNMDFYMKECDVAITAGGTTTYELCACGIPSILYTIADNQLGIARTFSGKGIIPWVGDIRKKPYVCLNNIIYEIRQLENKRCWEQRSRSMQSLVDGNGALRIAQEIINYDVRQRLS